MKLRVAKKVCGRYKFKPYRKSTHIKATNTYLRVARRMYVKSLSNSLMYTNSRFNKTMDFYWFDRFEEWQRAGQTWFYP